MCKYPVHQYLFDSLYPNRSIGIPYEGDKNATVAKFHFVMIISSGMFVNATLQKVHLFQD